MIFGLRSYRTAFGEGYMNPVIITLVCGERCVVVIIARSKAAVSVIKSISKSLYGIKECAVAAKWIKIKGGVSSNDGIY